MRISDWSSDVCSSDLATFSVGAGATVPFILAWRPSHRPVERSIDPQRRLQETESWWLGWSGRCQFGGGGPDHWRDAVTRSLITLKALTFAPTKSEEHTSELQSLMRISYAVFCLKNKNKQKQTQTCQKN